jgi:hypothetical protein
MIKTLITTVAIMISSVAYAGGQNAVSSCYSDKVPAPKAIPDVEMFVIVDQTTPFDSGLKQAIANNVRPFIKAGSAISVVQFSAFMQGHYTDVLVSVNLDPELPQDKRGDISKPLLNKFDQCQRNQPRQAGQLVGAALKTAFGNSSSGIDKSDVLASLKDISAKSRQSKAQRKIVLLASDMLENSSISSFYSKQAVRQINIEQELALVKKSNLFGDFGNAEVYVIGAGLLAEESIVNKKTYRSPHVMNALSGFWKGWFEKSNASLIEFGQPALLNLIQ